MEPSADDPLRRVIEALDLLPSSRLDEVRRSRPDLPLLDAIRRERALPDDLLRRVEDLVRAADRHAGPASQQAGPASQQAGAASQQAGAATGESGATAIVGSRAGASGMAGLIGSVGRVFRGGPESEETPDAFPGTAREDPLKGAERFGRYTLRERIGAGGMGAVYRAWDPVLEREVAIKVMSRDVAASEEESRTLASRFATEARAAATLSHPNLVAVHEVGEVDGVPYFTQELVPGRSLDRLLEERRPSPEESLRLIAAAARGLHHAHGRGVVHRDVKPSNLLVGDDLRIVKVADFGLARRAEARGETVTGQVLGTPHYMSPEQARGDLAIADPRTDVYGLGAVLYECLTGKRPFQEVVDLWRLIGRVAEGEPLRPRKRNRRVPEEVEWICLRCMERDPVRRYPSAQALADDIDRYLAGQPIEARPPSVLYRLRKVVRRNRWAWGIGAAAVLAGGIALVLIARTARLREAESRAAQHAGSARALAQRAGVAFAAGDIPEADRLAREALTELPSQPDALYWQARLLLRRYLAQRGLPGVRIALGYAEVLSPRPETAADRARRAEIERRLARTPGATLVSGFISMADGRFEEALAQFCGVRDEDPGSWEARLGEAQALYLLGRFREAEERMQPHLGFDAALVGPVWWRLAVARGLEARLAGEEPSGWFAQADAMGLQLGRAGLAAEGRMARARAQLEWGRAWAEMGRDPEERYARALGCLEGLNEAEALAARGDALLARADHRARRGLLDPDHPVEYAQAIDACSRAVERDRHDVPSRCLRAEAYRARWAFQQRVGRADLQDLERARDDYAAAGEDARRSVEAHVGLAWTRATLARFAARDRDGVLAAFGEHVDALSDVVQAHASAAAPLFARAQASRELGDYRGERGLDPSEAYRAAIEDLTQATTVNPAFAEAFRERALARQNLARSIDLRGGDPKGEFEAAIEDFSRALAIHPLLAEALMDRGLARQNLGLHLLRRGKDPSDSFLQGIEDISSSLLVNPGLAEAFLQRGMSRQNLGAYRFRCGGDPTADYQAAIDDMTRATRINPQFAQALLHRGIVRQNLAYLFERRGRDPVPAYEEAIADETAALVIHPSLSEAFAQRGLVRQSLAVYLLGKGKHPVDMFEEALADYSAAIEKNPASAEAWKGRGLTRQNLGFCRKKSGEDPTADYLAAIEDFTRSLAIDASAADALAQRALARQNLGFYREGRGGDPVEDYRQAIEDFRAALAIDASDAESWMYLGVVLLNRGRHRGGDHEDLSAALEALTAAVGANPGSAESFHYRGLVLLDLDRPKEALSDLDHAVVLNPDLREAVDPSRERARAAIR